MTPLGSFLAFLIFGAFFGGVGLLIWRQSKIGRRRGAEFEARADREGWRVEDGREGRQKVTSVTASDGSWVLRLGSGYSYGVSGSHRHSVPGFTELRIHAPTWHEAAIFTRPLPGWVRRVTGYSSVTGFVQNAAVKAVVGKMAPAGVMDEASRMRPFEAPPGVELGIMATDDPRDLDLKAIHDLIHGFRAQHQRGMAPNSVTLGPEGLRIRLMDALNDDDDMVAFIDAGLALAERLKR